MPLSPSKHRGSCEYLDTTRVKTRAVMGVVTSLAEDSFGFDKRETAQANMGAFAKAQRWAWQP